MKIALHFLIRRKYNLLGKNKYIIVRFIAEALKKKSVLYSGRRDLGDKWAFGGSFYHVQREHFSIQFI